MLLRGGEEEGAVAVDVAMVRWRSIWRGVALVVAVAAAEEVGVKSVRQQQARAASGRRAVGRDIAVRYGTVYPPIAIQLVLVVVGGADVEVLGEGEKYLNLGLCLSAKRSCVEINPDPSSLRPNCFQIFNISRSTPDLQQPPSNCNWAAQSAATVHL